MGLENEQLQDVDTNAADDAAEQEAFEAARTGAEPPKVTESPAPAELEPVVPTVETPPEQKEPQDPVKELQAQVARIPELEKQLRDHGGRYGALKQTIEQLQQRLTAPASQAAADSAAVDVKDLLKGLEDGGFTELAGMLKPAFEKLVATRGSGPSTDDIDRAVSERLQKGQAETLRKAQEALAEDHPDWQTIRTTPEYKAWLETLAPRNRTRFETSIDPYFVAEQLDHFKEWRKAEAEKKTEPVKDPVAEPAPDANQRSTSTSRLEAAITPKGSGAAPQAGAVSEQEAFDAARKAAAAARRRR